MSLDYKGQTILAYDLEAEHFRKQFQESLDLVAKPVLDKFLRMLPPQGSVLDVGSGPGIKAAYAQQHGYTVVCVDLSPEMVKLCKERDLRAHVMDLENLTVEPNSFDGVIAYTSLLHVPKSRLPGALEGIKRAVSHTGHVLLAMKEGSGEGFNGSDESFRRWFSYYDDAELKKYLRGFNVVHQDRATIGRSTFLHYILSRHG